MLALFIACQPADDDLVVVDRAPGDRAPLTGSCNALDDVRCHLPWPSSTFTVAADTSTGLHLSIDADALPFDDDTSFVESADGFSRVSPLAAGFDGLVDDSDWAGSVWLVVAEPGHERYGERIPVWTEVAHDSFGQDTLLLAYPQRLLPPDAEHLVVVTDELTGDTPQSQPRGVQVALGLAEPRDQDEADLLGYHAPARSQLDELGLDPAQVLRIWDFTTRSADDHSRRLRAMNATLSSELDALEVVIEVSAEDPDDAIERIVMGHLAGVPSFLDDDGKLVLDDPGLPVVTGTTDAYFRVVVPAGEGDYRVALYGHGTGGDYTDNSFDGEIAANGLAKTGVRWRGWTGDDLLWTLSGLYQFFDGSAVSTAGLMQSLADASVILSAMDGALGDALAADTLLGEANPAAGRRPVLDMPVWVGGSQGGCMGSVLVAVDERLDYGVLNVPGGGWTHMIPGSLLYETAIESLLLTVMGDDMVTMRMALAMSQTAWDEIDGAAWGQDAVDGGGMFLLQESMGDPILPNPGTAILAEAMGAVMLQPELEDVPVLDDVSGSVSVTALTQYRVPNTGQYDVHGFAARETPAGDAAIEQIFEFLTSAYEGDPVISFPDGCANVTDDGTCDFSGMWDE